MTITPHVEAVSLSAEHNFSKPVQETIKLLKGLGIEGDAHLGVTVQHLYDKGRNPDQPNLRQVHLIHGELLDTLKEDGFAVSPGAMGENVTTRGIDLLGLPQGARLTLGEDAVVEITGLRNPCHQLDKLQKGLMGRLVFKNESGEIVRLCGVMGIVLEGGTVAAGDGITVELPPLPHRKLERV
ncbi:MOSC domain-containing protein [Radicibacter daui]|uniref:MOSC domain-containing protein n=1 Tax=Radicibacter daui TaxID=3064829 RepID=UPI0040469234